jgi:hypothetical protein
MERIRQISIAGSEIDGAATRGFEFGYDASASLAFDGARMTTHASVGVALQCTPCPSSVRTTIGLAAQIGNAGHSCEVRVGKARR